MKTKNEVYIEEKIKKLKKMTSIIVSYAQIKLDVRSVEIVKENLRRELLYFKSRELDGRWTHSEYFLDTFFQALKIYDFDTKENIEILRSKVFNSLR